VWGRHRRGNHSVDERGRGASARLAVLVAALVLVLGGCAFGDPITKSRTESVRGAAWPGVETEQVSLEDGTPVVRMITSTPEPSTTPSPFLRTFEVPGGSAADSRGTPTAGSVVPPTPGRVFWPLNPPAPADPAGPVAPEFDELDHTPTPEPSTDPCDAVGVLPAECDPEPDPCDDAGGDSDEECEPPDCEDPSSGDGEPTPPPTTGAGDSEATPSPAGSSGEGEPTAPPTDEPCDLGSSD